MKTRHGFVSNSSSSSFVVALPKEEELNFANLAKNMFPGNDDLRGGFGTGYSMGVSTPEAVRSVLEQIKENGIANDETLTETVGNLRYGDCPEFLRELAKEEPDYETMVYGSKNYSHQRHNMSPEESRAAWAKYDEASSAWREKVIQALKEHAVVNNLVWYTLEYGDDSSFGAAMEHGGVFSDMVDRNMAIRISNH